MPPVITQQSSLSLLPSAHAIRHMIYKQKNAKDVKKILPLDQGNGTRALLAVDA